MSQEYGPREQYGRTFSDNKILGDNGDNFFDLSLDEQVNISAFSEGCPVREKVKARYIVSGEGLEGARDRYGAVRMARYEVIDAVKDVNPTLYAQLTSPNPISRLICPSGNYIEPVGEHEPVSVSQSHIHNIDPNNTPWGYANPRLFLTITGDSNSRTPESSFKALMLVEVAADPKKSTNPIEFLVNFGELAANSGVDVDQILKVIMSNGYLKEENTHVLFRELLSIIKNHAPKLWNRYTNLTPEDKARLGIAELGTIK